MAVDLDQGLLSKQEALNAVQLGLGRMQAIIDNRDELLTSGQSSFVQVKAFVPCAPNARFLSPRFG